jgi:hypothetical protein
MSKPEKPARDDVEPAVIDRLHPKLAALTVIVLLIIVVFVIAAGVFMIPRNEESSPFFIILLFSFAFMSLSCMILSSKANLERVNLGGVFVFSLGGSAAAWVIAFLITSWAYDKYYRSPSNASVYAELREVHKKADIDAVGYIPYGDWKERELGHVAKLYESGEDKVIGRVLAAADRSNHKNLPSKSTVEMAYVYLDKYRAIAFRRLKGWRRRDFDTIGCYTEAFPSNSFGEVLPPFIFDRSSEEDDPTLITPSESGWLNLKSPEVDVLAVVAYADDLVQNGDYVILQTRWYAWSTVDLHLMVFGQYELGGTPRVWRIKTSQYAKEDEVPLVLQQVKDSGLYAEHDSSVLQKYVGQIDQLLDSDAVQADLIKLRSMKKEDHRRELRRQRPLVTLAEIRAGAGVKSLASLLDPARRRACVSLRGETRQVVVTYEWKSKTKDRSPNIDLSLE